MIVPVHEFDPVDCQRDSGEIFFNFPSGQVYIPLNLVAPDFFQSYKSLRQCCLER
jgi:hypothetical protein